MRTDGTTVTSLMRRSSTVGTLRRASSWRGPAVTSTSQLGADDAVVAQGLVVAAVAPSSLNAVRVLAMSSASGRCGPSSPWDGSPKADEVEAVLGADLPGELAGVREDAALAVHLAQAREREALGRDQGAGLVLGVEGAEEEQLVLHERAGHD